MANFRCERLFVMLDEPVPDLDHLNAVDALGFAALMSEDLSFWLTAAGLTPLVDFVYAPFDRPKWRPAAKGLKSVRGAAKLFHRWLSTGTNPLGWSRDRMEQALAALDRVVEVLDTADSRDRRFYFAARDLA